MESVLDTIKKRHSVRYYGEREIEKDTLQIMKHYLDGNTKDPLGGGVRFDLVDGTGYGQAN